MTMPSSGALNMGETTSPVSVNYELGKASPYNQTVSMNDSNVRSLAGVSSVSGSSWSMSSLYGKSAAVPDLSLLDSSYYAGYQGVYPVTGTLDFDPTGAWYWFDDNGEQYGGFWVSSGAGAGVGSGFWLRITRTATSGSNGGSTTSTGWVNMGSSQYVTVTKSLGGTIAFNATYTFEISNSSSGSPVLSSRTGVIFEAARV